MNAKRTMRWVIVLFLLAALPGLTVALAQEQEPALKDMSPSTEVGESTAPEFNVWESEPNNTMGQADVMTLGDVMGADFNYAGDVDWFKFRVHTYGTAVLVDTDGIVFNADVDTRVWLYDAAGNELGYNDDSGTLDSLLFNVSRDGWYYVKVEEFGNDGGLTYDLIVSSPLLISAHAAKLGTATVGGVSFRAEDILAFSDLNDGQEKWVMFLDASDIGIVKQIVNLSTGWVAPPGQGSPRLAVSFNANQVLPDHTGTPRTFKPWDWAIICLDQIGVTSVLRPNCNQFQAGLPHGLSTKTEKPDAISVWSVDDGQGDWTVEVNFSTVGAAAVPKAGGGVLKVPDEDVFLSETWSGHNVWDNYRNFDGSTIYNLGVEDVFAMDYNHANGFMYLTILGNGNIDGEALSQLDIFAAQYALEGSWQYEGRVWHGPDHGWNYKIDAFDWPGN